MQIPPGRIAASYIFPLSKQDRGQWDHGLRMVRLHLLEKRNRAVRRLLLRRHRKPEYKLGSMAGGIPFKPRLRDLSGLLKLTGSDQSYPEKRINFRDIGIDGECSLKGIDRRLMLAQCGLQCTQFH